MRRRAVTAVATLVAVATSVVGCGLGAGKGTSDVSVVVTQDFGHRVMGSMISHRVAGSETVMRLLERSFRVRTRYGGGFVEAIDGASGAPPHRDWFYYVNGVEASIGAASTAVHRGDRIWWDLHDWSATNSVPAVVGSFPEPFVHGVAGKRLPVAVECGTAVQAACERVSSELTSLGVPVASQLLGTGSGTDSLGVIVATWRELRRQIVGGLIARGPATSGVYARFGGQSLQLLDPRGRVVRSIGTGAGLIAATRDNVSEPVWLVTGTDPAGVAAAARGLDPGRLRDHFALAIDGRRDVALPVEGG